MVSIEDETGQRCVDIVEDGGRFGWSECRRDPEDAHGWRRLHGAPEFPFQSYAEAQADARRRVGWIA